MNKHLNPFHTLYNEHNDNIHYVDDMSDWNCDCGWSYSGEGSEQCCCGFTHVDTEDETFENVFSCDECNFYSTNPNVHSCPVCDVGDIIH